jgi:hypothetical protein
MRARQVDARQPDAGRIKKFTKLALNSIGVSGRVEPVTSPIKVLRSRQKA